MKQPAQCPSNNDLRAFLIGATSEDQSDSIGAHLQDCEHCLSQVEQIEGSAEPYFGNVSQDSKLAFTEESDCQRLADKILADDKVKASSNDKTINAEDTTEAEDTTDFEDTIANETEALRKDEFAGYQLNKKIGQGGMGVVWNATQLRTNREVALKILNIAHRDRTESQARFDREIELAGRLEHPNIARVYEGGATECNNFYVMQLIEGLELGEYAKTNNITPKQTVQILSKLCEGIQYAHQNGVIHRDLKPQNILVDSQGNPFVTDFGLAKNVDTNDDLTMTGQVIGTPSYIAPEQISDPKHSSTAVDVYGLGAIMYRLLTGQPPFQGSNPIETLKNVTQASPTKPSQLNNRVDQDLETICLKCLEKNPKDRFPSVHYCWMNFDDGKMVNRFCRDLSGCQPEYSNGRNANQ